MIYVVDYGLGNVGAFLTLLNRLNVPAKSCQSADELISASHILLPGVGSFDHAMDLLEKSGMRNTLEELVMEKKVPVLGVCVGMQILGNRSEEGIAHGLGWIPGTIKSLSTRFENQRLPLPHMGWNDVEPTRPLALFNGLADSRFYFLHSFFFDNENPEDAAAIANYGRRFTCVVNRGNVWGVQFHPEKSHHFGMALLKNFAEL